jgi:hypothetical protein
MFDIATMFDIADAAKTAHAVAGYALQRLDAAEIAFLAGYSAEGSHQFEVAKTRAAAARGSWRRSTL